jgi:hypothetical protein
MFLPDTYIQQMMMLADGEQIVLSPVAAERNNNSERTVS